MPQIRLSIEVESTVPAKNTLDRVALALTRRDTVDLVESFPDGENFTVDASNMKITITKNPAKAETPAAGA